MVPLGAPEFVRLSRALQDYDLLSTATRVGGLLTVPELQANTIRIQTLAHLVVANCRGRRIASPHKIGSWLNRYLGKTSLPALEDPTEDVFITNVMTPRGNRRLFEGIWEANAYFVQVVIDTLNGQGVPQECRDLLVPIFALLLLSERVADRLNLERWSLAPSYPKSRVRIPKDLTNRAKAISFSERELSSLGIEHDALAPFVLREPDKRALRDELVGDSSLERRPVLDLGGELVLALPQAVSPAIRRYVLTELQKTGYLRAFGKALAKTQARQLQERALLELRKVATPVKPPMPHKDVPSLAVFLLRYDINKYLNVLLLNDRMDEIEEQGLSSPMRYPENLRLGLQAYINQVAEYCSALPDFSRGFALLVWGGLGRGLALSLDSMPKGWRLSVIGISDLLTIAAGTEQPIKRYLKFVEQQDWLERQGVRFPIASGDFNQYCSWRQADYQLVPRDLPVSSQTAVYIENGMALPVRKEAKQLIDLHCIAAADGIYHPAIRFGAGAYFKSMVGRPIYASLDHVTEGILAGAVETTRGPSWLVVDSGDCDRRLRGLVYEIWSGFVGLFDRLVHQTEILFPEASAGPVELHLDFSRVRVPEQVGACEPRHPDPEVESDIVQRTAKIRLPAGILAAFQGPDNIGEGLIMRSLAKGFLQLLGRDADEEVVEELVRTVVDSPGVRVLHLFRTYFPLEHLLSRPGDEPTFLAPEDIVFSRLGLSKGCVPEKSGSSIEGVDRCNHVLNRIVDKVWHQLRELLRRLDRGSVVRQALQVCEQALRDRDHWRRTAGAVLALYGPREDAFAAAQEREMRRSSVSIAARTILEMAVCECPKDGGRPLCLWDLDELLAKAALLVEVATDSDAIRNDLTAPRIEVHPNGEYTANRDYRDTLIKPFVSGFFEEEFENAAEEYPGLYQKEPPADRKRFDEVLSSSFVQAFRHEFGLSPDEVADGLAELMDWAVERDRVIVETTLGELRARLSEGRLRSATNAEAFIRAFSIFHRPAWDIAPPGYRQRDLYPWRFRRRLSFVAKPILVFGDNDKDRVFYGAGTLVFGVQYVLERSEGGHLPQDFYTDLEMQKYIGKVNNERGTAFAQSVADRYRQEGWQTRSLVQMTELGAAQELGDVDVLAWKSTGEVLITECKRLQLARTVAEVAEVCRRFRGEAMDELARHVRRVEWIKDNPECLQAIIGRVPNRDCIDERLVTSTHVPLMYLDCLPIEATKIVPLDHMR